MLQEILCVQNVAGLRAEPAPEGLQRGENADPSSSVTHRPAHRLQECCRTEREEEQEMLLSPHIPSEWVSPFYSPVCSLFNETKAHVKIKATAPRPNCVCTSQGQIQHTPTEIKVESNRTIIGSQETQHSEALRDLKLTIHWCSQIR